MNIRENINKSLRTALLAIPLIGCGTALMLTGCQDDHFDVVSNQLTGDQTIWQHIQSRPELSQYADILQSVYYSQTEEKTTSETYADIFNGDQTFTVWAPVNGQFDYDYYKQLLATGIRENIYKVENELIRNNMTRFSNIVSGSDSVKLDLFNSKYAWLNYDKRTIKGVEITEPNIGSSNGVLHITNGAMEYQPNLYEYLAINSDLDSINQFIRSFQTTEFDDKASTPGPTVNGVVTWVDSVTNTSNQYLTSYMNARINREDSNYVMILPTNNAWDNVLEKIKKYYRYKTSTYVQYLQSTGTTINRPKLSESQVDSLQNIFSKNAISQNTAFNANWQYNRIPITSISDIKAADARGDSLRTTSGLKIKKTGTLNKTNYPSSTVEIDDFAAMFGNADPVELSNGYAYIIDEYPYPYTLYAPEHDLSALSCYEGVDYSTEPPVFQRWEKPETIEIRDTIFNAETGEPEIDEETGEILTELVASRDSVYKYDYLVFDSEGATSISSRNANIWFKLKNVLSCKYDIFVVVGYSDKNNAPSRFMASITYDNENGHKNVDLTNPNEDAVDATGASLYGTNIFVNKVPTVDENLVKNYTDTICVAKDFEFPVSYYNFDYIDGMGGTYPLLKLNFYMNNTVARTYSRELRINAIILKAKEW